MGIHKIVRAWVVEGLGGWYCDDKQAIVKGAQRDAYVYQGQPLTPGFRTIREPGEALLVTLESQDGAVGAGDCVSVTYAGGAGRDRPFHTADHITQMRESVLPRLLGRSWRCFRDAAIELERLCTELPLHPAICYGLSQALLNLSASAEHCTVTEIICREYGLPLPKQAVPVGIQTGDDRYIGADKAILKHADILPHGLIKTEQDLGARGEALIAYARWLKDRIGHLGGPEFAPIIHFDVYGSLGRAFENDVGRIADFIIELEEAVQPYALQIESPVEMDSQPAQIAKMAQLCQTVRHLGSRTQIIADEWCNTLEDIKTFAEAGACDIAQVKMPDLGNVAHSIEAVLLCKQAGVGAYLGGSCNETDVSTRISVGIALATRADQMLAKPGMGVDEALMIVKNEMARTLGRIRPCLTPRGAVAATL